MIATLPLLWDSDFPPLRRGPLTTLQVNLGYRCNQSCIHCHVNAGPNRSETMNAANLALIPSVIQARDIEALDLTGGAPELNAGYRRLVGQVAAMGVKIIDRCNLTILAEPGQQDLAAFLADHGVEVVASLPCYSAENVDRQRGEGVFETSIDGLRQLNRLGYAHAGSGLVLNLVYNPQGPELPPPQPALEADYRRRLRDGFGIEFDHLFVLTNMPIKRFGSMLVSKGQFGPYMQLLKQSFTQENLHGLMCRSTISVDWRGYMYDCDFNQQLELPLAGNSRPHLRDLLRDDFQDQAIRVADHCYGCTAGQGSSCGGALLE